MKAVLRQRLLWVAATDDTFDSRVERGQSVLVGKCIHCQKKLVLDSQGQPISAATLEHIVPRHHGGTNRADNLAIACASCNSGKGLRLDHLRRDDPRLSHVVQLLLERRSSRRRDPPQSWVLPPPPPEWFSEGPDPTPPTEPGPRRGPSRRKPR